MEFSTGGGRTYVVQLLVDMSNLEVNVDLSERRRGDFEDIHEALPRMSARMRHDGDGEGEETHSQRLLVRPLLLVDDAQAEEYLVALVERLLAVLVHP